MNISRIVKIFYAVLLFVLVVGFSFDNNNNIVKSDNYNNPQSKNKPWIAPKSADKLKNPLKDNKEAAKEGKKLFSTYCVVCHGDKGEGNGSAAAALNPKPKNLTSSAVQKQTDGAIFWKITTGNSPMLSWESTLSKKQRWQLVDFIRQLKKK